MKAPIDTHDWQYSYEKGMYCQRCDMRRRMVFPKSGATPGMFEFDGDIHSATGIEVFSNFTCDEKIMKDALE